MHKLEKLLAVGFSQMAPKLPEDAKKALTDYLPWMSLLLGFVTVAATYSLWHWAHLTPEIAVGYGANALVSRHLTFGIWLGMVVLSIEALLYLFAFSGLRDRKKHGWDLLFYAILVNIAYALIIFFTAYEGVLNLVGSLIGSIVGLYLLFQVRGVYLSL